MTVVMAGGAILLYLVATVLLSLRPRDTLPIPRTWTLALGWGGALCHGLFLKNVLVTPGGIDLSFFSTAALVSFLVVLLFLLAAIGKPIDKLGIAVLPLAVVTLALRLAFPHEVHLLGHLPPGLQVHILISVLAFSLLNIAALQAVLLAFQDWQLHHKRAGRFVRSLPPLQTMESLLFQMIGAGFALLNLSLLSGFLFVEDLFAQHLVHKTVLSIVSWGVFGLLLWGRWHYGWRGKTAIRWTLGGFAALLLAYFGSKLVLELILRRG